jgi:hypothetical protein
MRQVGAGGRLEPLRLGPGEELMVLVAKVKRVGDDAVIGLTAGGAMIQVPLSDVEEHFEDRRTVRDALAIEKPKRKRAA